MPNTRENLMRLLCTANSKATEAEAFENATYAEQLGIQADHLIANGVTFAKDTDVLTNADRIRAMSDEELADWLQRLDCMECPAALNCLNMHKTCNRLLLEWLKQPVEE